MSTTAPHPLAPPRPPGEDELPFEDGEPMESTVHQQQMTLLIHALKWHLRDRHDVFVGGNLAVYYSDLQVARNDFRAPDVLVVLGVDPRPRKSWVVWAEDGRAPDVVIEILSEATAENDRGLKKRIYERALRVAEYYLFDPETAALEGYRLDAASGHYQRIEPLPGGDLECRCLGLRLGPVACAWEGHQRTWLRWSLPDGTPAPTAAEAGWGMAEAERERAEAERERAEAERERAEAERKRADRLAAKLRAAGIDPGE